MSIDELKTKWELRIYTLTDQMNNLPANECEKLLIKEERETLIRCLEELKQLNYE